MQQKIQKSVPNSNNPVARMVNQKEKFVDNRPVVQQQRELCSKISNAPIQRFNAGFVPTNPNNYRGFTRLVGSTNATNGGGNFSNGDRTSVQTNNIGNSGGNVAFPAMAAQHPTSDISGNGILTYNDGYNLTPELDHIVEKSAGGANDLENARLISKGENNNPATIHPHVPSNDVSLRLYENVQITSPTYPGFPLAPLHLCDIVASINLDHTQIKHLYQHATGLPLGAVNTQVLTAIQNDNNRNTQNGITLT